MHCRTLLFLVANLLRSWAVVVNVQAEGEGRLLSVAAIVPDPGATTPGLGVANGGGGGGGNDQSLDAALAEGLRCATYWGERMRRFCGDESSP